MNELILRLIPDNQEPQDLVLQQHRLAGSILDVVNTSDLYVFNDYRYRAQLVNVDSTIRNLVILLNGKDIRCNYSTVNGMIEFQDFSFGQRIFLECYGFVQFTMIFDDSEGNHQVLDSEYIQVMVRKGRQNDSVRRMTEYIYNRNPDLLNTSRTMPKDTSGLKDVAQQTIESHILLLEQISVVYEENYRYFKMNSRFTTVPKEYVDHFEKLQTVSPNTLRYIARHPEELHRLNHSAGIKIGNYRYQPNRTLITYNEKSFDIYENRIVLGFLTYLLKEVKRVQSELNQVMSQMPGKTMEKGEYITSSYFIYANTVESIKVLLSDVERLKHKYTSLYFMYSEILPIKASPVSVLPKFTPVFKSIPQYHQIYSCITAWFSKGVFSIQEKQFMLSFVKISALYELYVLANLINYFRNNGCTLTMADRISYPSPGKYYENTECNNRFEFQTESAKITVYYQPVIYNSNKSSISGIGLYRNTSISFPKFGQENTYGGKYYTPDYLIKYEYPESGEIKYLVADAKFSKLETVKYREVAELAYKYLFSLSPVSEKEQVIGLCIFNGQSETTKDIYTNIYDFELPSRITPRADIVTLTENSKHNIELHGALLRNTVGLYVTEIPQKLVKLPEEKTLMEEVRDIPPQSLKVEESKRENPEQAISSVEPLEKETVQAPLDNVPPQKPDKISKHKSKVDLDVIKIEELNLGTALESVLHEAGYFTAQDLAPQGKKSDLTNIKILNRKARREIEARLKLKRCPLK